MKTDFRYSNTLGWNTFPIPLLTEQNKADLTACAEATLNRLVVIFLEQAELRVKQRQDLSLAFWRNNVDKMLAFNDQPILEGAGAVSRERMERVAHERYELFDQQRKEAERAQADTDDLKEIEQLEHSIKHRVEKP